MAPGTFDAQTTHPLQLVSVELTVVLICGETVVSQPLPKQGPLIIGRAADAGLRVDDASISRRHACLWVGAQLEIEDLGSSNGTRVHGKMVAAGQRVCIAVGDIVDLGAATLVVQRAQASVRPRRVVSHDYFELRVEEECELGAARGGHFAVARISVDKPLPDGRERELIAGVLRTADVLAVYAPNEYEVLLREVGVREADELVTLMARELVRAGAGVRTSVVHFPADGRSADALLARAGARARGRPVPAGATDTGPVVVDPWMRELYALIERIAASNVSVLVLGETGVGKELVAEALHARSARAAAPLLKLNCATLSESLLESELFGHERGAFTDAHKDKPGLFEMASGGTLVLDEVGELPQAIQAKLLRALEERSVRRVGGTSAIPIDVRLVSATNRDLEAEVRAGRFRADLYYRLNGIALTIKPLRERPAELEPLARRFMERAAADMGRGTLALAPATLELMRSYTWPGNIRELKNLVERAVLLCTGEVLEPEHFPVDKMSVSLVVPAVETAPDAATQVRETTKLTRDAEVDRLMEALNACAGNQTLAAKKLGISRSSLVRRLDAFGISRPRKGQR